MPCATSWRIISVLTHLAQGADMIPAHLVAHITPCFLRNRLLCRQIGDRALGRWEQPE